MSSDIYRFEFSIHLLDLLTLKDAIVILKFYTFTKLTLVPLIMVSIPQDKDTMIVSIPSIS